MAGRAGSTRRVRMQGRRATEPNGRDGEFSLQRCTTGQEGAFSRGGCTTTKHISVEAAATGQEVAFSLGRCTITDHMPVEEVAIREDGAFLPRPCTTSKHMVVEVVADGDEGPLKKGKRKLTSFEMFPAQEKPRWHWADPLPKSGSTTEDAELRKRIKAALLGFPESGALSAAELELSIDRIMKESKPETKSVAAPGMVRLSNEQIRLWLFMKNPTVDDILGVEAGGVFPPGWIQQRALILDAQCQRKTKDDELLLVDKIRIDLITKGYAEFREEYVSPDSDDECSESEEEVTSRMNN